MFVYFVSKEAIQIYKTKETELCKYLFIVVKFPLIYLFNIYL